MVNPFHLLTNIGRLLPSSRCVGPLSYEPLSYTPFLLYTPYLLYTPFLLYIPSLIYTFSHIYLSSLSYALHLLLLLIGVLDRCPMNPSQLAALVEAVTRPISLIQGPPGTGKTRS